MILVLAVSLVGCDRGGTATTAQAPTTMPNPSAPAGMNQFSYLAADGGPHMILPVELAAWWSGSGSLVGALNKQSDYWRACSATANTPIAPVAVGNGSALIIANPPMTAWGISADGLVEIYDLQSWTNTNLDALLHRATSSLSTTTLKDSGLKLHLKEPDLYLLYAGDTPTSTAYGVHRILLSAGTYHVLGDLFRPGRRSNGLPTSTGHIITGCSGPAARVNCSS